MKILKSLFPVILLFPFITIGQVQSVLPVGTAKDGSLTAVVYDWEVVGVNPANLGWDVNHRFSFTILDAGISGQSTGMNLPTLSNAIGSPSLITRATSWQSILGTPRGMNAYGDINWFAASFRVPVIPGAFAVNLRDRIMGTGYFGFNTSQALIHSGDETYSDATILSFFNGTSLDYLHYREINLDYGVKLFSSGGGFGSAGPDESKCFSFDKNNSNLGDDEASTYAGIGIKYIFGVADVNGGISNGGINAIYDMYPSYPNIPKDFFNTPGHGYALDLGLSEKYRRWTFGLSATDLLGSIRWKNGSETTHDTNVTPIKNGSDFMDELKTGTLGGSVPEGDYTTYIQAKIRLGASYILTKRVLLSSDIIFPLNSVVGGLQGPYFALGGQWKATKIITICTGFTTTTNFGWGLPLGVTVNATKRISFYAGTNDITAYLGKPTNANVSAAIWMFRYDL